MITFNIGSGDEYWTDEAIDGLVGQVVNLKGMPGQPAEVPAVVVAAQRDPKERFIVTLTIDAS